MFLFSKRTRNVIKYLWAVFAVLIILSMVFAYSGFTSLTSAPSYSSNDIPPEVLAELEREQANLVPPTSEVVPDATTTHENTPMADAPVTDTEEKEIPLPPTPPAPLDFSI